MKAFIARSRPLLTLLAFVVPMRAAVAQPAPHTMPPMQPPAAQPAATTTQMVKAQAAVLVAMTGDPALDAQLRATADALKQKLQERGYGDVDAARLHQELAADPSGIGTLRTRLNAHCMVRVDVQAHDFSGAALMVTVQTPSGDQTAQVQGRADEIPGKVMAAVDPLIPQAPPPTPTTVPVPPPTQAPPPAAAGLDRVVLVDGTVLEGRLGGFAGGSVVTLQLVDGTTRQIPWSEVRQIIPNAGAGEGNWSWAKSEQREPEPSGDWEKRGGSLLTLDLQGQILGALARSDHPYVVNYPDGQSMTFTGDSPAGGGGIGLGFHFGFMQLEIPKPAESTTLWAFRLGTGIDVGQVAFAYRTPSNNQVGRYQANAASVPLEQEGGTTEWTSATVVMLPLFLGGQIGSGQFVGPGLWRGVMFGIDWRPTYTYTKPGDDLDSISSFNYLGVQAHVDMGSINADREGLESNFRITVTYLPTIDRNASYAALGFGAVWY